MPVLCFCWPFSAGALSRAECLPWVTWGSSCVCQTRAVSAWYRVCLSGKFSLRLTGFFFFSQLDYIISIYFKRGLCRGYSLATGQKAFCIFSVNAVWTLGEFDQLEKIRRRAFSLLLACVYVPFSREPWSWPHADTAHIGRIEVCFLDLIAPTLEKWYPQTHSVLTSNPICWMKDCICSCKNNKLRRQFKVFVNPA